jgi:hypothetical protein
MAPSTRKGGTSVNRSTALRASDAHERQVVLLVEPSPLHQAVLAFALVAAGFDVQLPETLGSAGTPRFAIVNLEDLREEDADPLLSSLLDAHHDVPLILRSSDPPDAEAGARTLGLNVAMSLAKDVLEREVVEMACQWCLSGSTGGNDGRVSLERVIPGALQRVPVLAVGRDDLGWFEATPDQAAFLASIDGRRDLETIATRTGREPSVVMTVARTLVEEGLIVLT